LAGGVLMLAASRLLLGVGEGGGFPAATRAVAEGFPVNDRATAELMKNFYGRILGADPLSPAAALRAAQISMWKQSRWRAPYYWASFILSGEPR